MCDGPQLHSTSHKVRHETLACDKASIKSTLRSPPMYPVTGDISKDDSTEWGR